MVFPVVMYGCESWTIMKAEHPRIDAFGLWCGGKLLRVPWTARRSNQSILKEISPEYSLEGLMLKLKHQYFGHPPVLWVWGLLGGGEETRPGTCGQGCAERAQSGLALAFCSQHSEPFVGSGRHLVHVVLG